jgi:hypothetical protein
MRTSNLDARTKLILFAISSIFLLISCLLVVLLSVQPFGGAPQISDIYICDRNFKGTPLQSDTCNSNDSLTGAYLCGKIKTTPRMGLSVLLKSKTTNQLFDYSYINPIISDGLFQFDLFDHQPYPPGTYSIDLYNYRDKIGEATIQICNNDD